MMKLRVFLGMLAFAGMLAASSASAVAAQHKHPEAGPHKGALAEWGEEEYHLEFVPDSKAGTVAVYILDGEATKVKPIDAKTLVLTLKTTPPVTVSLEAAPEKGDGEGKSSKYVGKNDVFKKEMKFSGSISGKVGTKPYSGDFKQK